MLQQPAPPPLLQQLLLKAPLPLGDDGNVPIAAVLAPGRCFFCGMVTAGGGFGGSNVDGTLWTLLVHAAGQPHGVDLALARFGAC